MNIKCTKLTKRLMFILVFALGLASCAAPRYSGNSATRASEKKETDSELGVRYLLGRGVPQSDERAFDYFLRAAKDDDVFAQNEVAYLYAVGKGTAQDYAEALRYYQKAANHGLASAEYSVGLFYANGFGTEVNKDMAMKWFKQAAAHGFEPAKRALIKYAEPASAAPIELSNAPSTT